MSKAFYLEFGEFAENVSRETIREWSKRPGRHDDMGRKVYFTEQGHKKQCDVNGIVRKYDRDGLILHVSKFEAKYGDMTGLDFKSAHDKVLHAKESFESLPGEIRKRFRNDPSELLDFMSDPGNRDEAIKLGLINGNWTEETDGIGEYVRIGENKLKTDELKEEPPN